jgi:mannose-6-phosphate isomerase-like protein (cupin superfamily)
VEPPQSKQVRPGGSGGFVLAENQGEAYWWLGSLTINKVGGAATEGGLSIVDHRVPAGYAPPRHIHHGQDEVFYILAGQFSIVCGAQAWEAGPGSLVFLPRDVPHGFTVSRDGDGRTLLITAPGGFDALIQELGEPAGSLSLPDASRPQPDLARLAAVSAAHGISPAPPS